MPLAAVWVGGGPLHAPAASPAGGPAAVHAAGLGPRTRRAAGGPAGCTMLSPANGEQTHLASYVEDYLDSIESLPFDLQRNVSLMREIDAKYQGGRGRGREQKGRLPGGGSRGRDRSALCWGGRGGGGGRGLPECLLHKVRGPGRSVRGRGLPDLAFRTPVRPERPERPMAPGRRARSAKLSCALGPSRV